MPTLDDVYRKFGETAEAAHLLETELGTALMIADGVEEGLLTTANPGRAAELLDEINSSTLGRVLKRLTAKVQSSAELKPLLSKALVERNRLSHSFYRQHNFRRNTDAGRAIMLDDLQSIHDSIITAYKAVMLLSGIDLDSAIDSPTPTRHFAHLVVNSAKEKAGNGLRFHTVWRGRPRPQRKYRLPSESHRAGCLSITDKKHRAG